MKLKDGVKFALGLAIGRTIWYGLICNIVHSLLITYCRSDYWKEVYESSPEWYKEYCKALKPKKTKTEKDFEFGFQDSKSSGSK